MLCHVYTLFPAFFLCCSALAAADCHREGDAFRFWMKRCAKPSTLLLTNPPGFVPLQPFLEDLMHIRIVHLHYQNVKEFQIRF